METTHVAALSQIIVIRTEAHAHTDNVIAIYYIKIGFGARKIKLGAESSSLQLCHRYDL